MLSAVIPAPSKSLCFLFCFVFALRHRPRGGSFRKSQQNIVFLASQQWLEIKALKQKKKKQKHSTTHPHMLGIRSVSPPAGPPPSFPVTLSARWSSLLSDEMFSLMRALDDPPSPPSPPSPPHHTPPTSSASSPQLLPQPVYRGAAVWEDDAGEENGGNMQTLSSGTCAPPSATCTRRSL